MCQCILTRMEKYSMLAHAIVTLTMKYSMPIGRDCVHFAPFGTRSKDHKPKCYLSAIINLFMKRDILETQ